jgi:hypothetical protein
MSVALIRLLSISNQQVPKFKVLHFSCTADEFCADIGLFTKTGI